MYRLIREDDQIKHGKREREREGKIILELDALPQILILDKLPELSMLIVYPLVSSFHLSHYSTISKMQHIGVPPELKRKNMML